jgi:hypothetical protein
MPRYWGREGLADMSGGYSHATLNLMSELPGSDSDVDRCRFDESDWQDRSRWTAPSAAGYHVSTRPSATSSTQPSQSVWPDS